MKVNPKINPSPNQTNPSNPKTNPQLNLQPQPQISQNIELQKIVEDIVAKYLTQQQNNKTSTNNIGEDFVVKANMKSSVIAVRLEQILLMKKKVSMVALGYATAVELDTVMLIKKDMEKANVKINVQFELFEKDVTTNEKRKTITGLRAIVSI
jgi:hypothetical protein